MKCVQIHLLPRIFKRAISQSRLPTRLATTSCAQPLNQIWQQNMASPTKILLSVKDTGVYKLFPQNEATAAVASQLLQKNHEEFHIFFNSSGFHNHIVHHILSLYGLGAPASVLEEQFKYNASYQLPALPVSLSNVHDMTDPVNFKQYTGNTERYLDFRTFFQKEMEAKGVDGVLQEYVFAGDARADDLFARLFTGFLHPIIHLGFGLEFNQPAIVAEALAQAAVHPDWIIPFFVDSEKAATERGPGTKTLITLLDEIRQDNKLSTAAAWQDGNKIRDGILKRAPNEAIHYASQWTVGEQDLESKTVEMINTAIYFTTAAQHPPKQIKFDFYFMHCVNSSIFWTTFNKLPWLSIQNKIRLLEWKGRNDLVMYASRRSPPPLLEEITRYVPKDLEAGSGEWKGVFRRLFEFKDDGHAIKLGRAIAHGELVSAKYENEDWCKIRGNMWLRIGNMVIDSVEDGGETWARSVGFVEAWEGYKDRPRQAHI